MIMLPDKQKDEHVSILRRLILEDEQIGIDGETGGTQAVRPRFQQSEATIYNNDYSSQI